MCTAEVAVSSAPSSSVVVSLTQEVSSDVASTASTPSLSSVMSQQMTAVSTTTEQPVVTATDRLVNSSGGGGSDAVMMSKLSGLLSMLPTKPTLQPTVSVFLPSTVAHSSPSLPATAPTATPSAALQVVSDGNATPVKDEPEETVTDLTSESPPSQQPRVVDPIALLNQMLSQSRPASTTSSSSVNFLQSLTMLTKTVTSAGQTATDLSDDVYMGSYGKLDDNGAFTTTWSNHSRSDPDTGPPIKALDHESSQTTSTTVSVPIPLASQSMGPPPLQSIFSTSVIPDVVSCSSNVAASALSPVMNVAPRDHDLSSLSLNNRFPVASQSLEPADDTRLLPEKFAFRSDSVRETRYPLPGLDIDTIQNSGPRSGSLQENNETASFLFRPTDTNSVRNVFPDDEFTERLRRKTSMPPTDGMTSPPFPDNRGGALPVQTMDRTSDDGGRLPPIDPSPNNFPPQPPVYHDQPEVDAEYDRYGGRFDQWGMKDHIHEEFPMSSSRPLDPVYHNQFQPGPRQPKSPPMYPRPRPDFYPEPRRPVPNDDFRPRFMSRLPPPAAFTTLRPPPPPPPDRFQPPFFRPRF